MPVVRELVAKVATPALMFPVPMDVAPSRKVTVPVAPAVTVAVRVTLAPKVDGLGAAARAMVGVALFTTCDTGVETAVV